MLSEHLLPSVDYKLGTFTSHNESVRRVIKAMKEQLDRSLSLQDMAEIARFSPYHFSRVFRNTTGIPPAQFLYALRLQEAKQLLLTTRLSVTDICFEVGYNSLGTFTRRFTELVGVSPTKLRCLHNDLSRFSESLQDRYMQPLREILPKHGLTGRVNVPTSFSGLIFVGLFPTEIPQGQPTGCTFLTTSNTYSIAPVFKGTYFLFAAAYSCLSAPTFVGVGQGPLLVESAQTIGCTDITLRPADITDPPVLIAAPYLCAKHLAINNGTTA